jgi:methylated-DNA-[protein]-cysteine S-methyltransferase
MVLAAEGGSLVGAWFEGQRHFAAVGPGWAEDAGDPVLGAAAAQLAGYFAGERRAFELPLAPVGTPFQREVWRRIWGVGYGRTSTYGELATALGRPAAARAVGAATGRNPLAILVPCHRVVGRDGSLTGYAGGLERKRALLGLELRGR